MAGLDKPLVLVVWIDAYSLSNNEWHELDDLNDDPAIVHSVGFMTSKPNDRHVVLAQSLTEDQGVDGVLQIPRRIVRKIVRLQIPHKRRKSR
jgi:hypothetical protein